MLGTDVLAQLACIDGRALLCARRRLGAAVQGAWASRRCQVTTGQLTAGALMMLPLALLVDQPWTQPLPPLEAWGAIVALALVCTAFGYVLYFRLIEPRRRDQCAAGDPAGAADRHPARRACSSDEVLAPQRFRRAWR